MLGWHVREGGSDEIDIGGGPLRNKELGLPSRHSTRRIERGAQINQGRRSFRIPAMLIGPGPLYAHRLSNSPCKQGGNPPRRPRARCGRSSRSRRRRRNARLRAASKTSGPAACVGCGWLAMPTRKSTFRPRLRKSRTMARSNREPAGYEIVGGGKLSPFSRHRGCGVADIARADRPSRSWSFGHAPKACLRRAGSRL